jgi:hypothetical protein
MSGANKLPTNADIARARFPATYEQATTAKWPEPADADEFDDPLFDNTRDYLDQLDRYRKHKARCDDVMLKRRGRRKV